MFTYNLDMRINGAIGEYTIKHGQNDRWYVFDCVGHCVSFPTLRLAIDHLTDNCCCDVNTIERVNK